MRRSEIEDRFVGRYFDLFHPHWLFIHRGSFIEYETPLLVQSMVVIGLWMTEEKKTRCQAVDLHNVLGAAIRQQTVFPAKSHHMLVSFTKNTIYRNNGMVPSQRRHALPAHGLSQRTKLSCYT